MGHQRRVREKMRKITLRVQTKDSVSLLSSRFIIYSPSDSEQAEAESRRRGHGVEQEQEDELEAHWRGQAVWK